MAQLNKPDMSNIWASGGAVITPSGSKIQQGWVAEIPVHQWENYIQNRQDLAIAYLWQHGIPEWDATTEYWANKSYIQHGGDIYKCLVNNTNSEPTSSNTDWKSTTAPSSTTDTGVVRLATDVETQDGLSETIAVTPFGLSARTATETRTGVASLAPKAVAMNGTDANQIVTPLVAVSMIKKFTPNRITALTTGSGNFTVPADTYFLDVELWGGGGGGGGTGTAGSDGACGGGGGGYSRQIQPVTPGQVIPYTVGGGGPPGGGGGSGAGGGTSIFGGVQSATGGGGGGPNGSRSSGTGGSGAGGAVNSSGTAGGIGQSAVPNGALGGSGGGAPFGGAGGSSGLAEITGGAFPGGGGSGRGTTNTGSGFAGAPGLILIRY